MRIIWLISIVSIVFASNSFTFTDSNGKIIQKKIKHNHNASLNQNTKEYSYQAFYADLQKEKIAALQAQMASVKENGLNAKPTTQTQKQEYCNADIGSITQNAKQFKGGKYVWGGTRPSGFDCSGYVQYIYNKHGISLPRTAFAQSRTGKPVDKNNLRAGDLLFFLTDKNRGIPVTHVGIYLGNGEFIHAASKDKGIIVSPLNYGSYANIFVGAKRVLPS